MKGLQISETRDWQSRKRGSWNNELDTVTHNLEFDLTAYNVWKFIRDWRPLNVSVGTLGTWEQRDIEEKNWQDKSDIRLKLIVIHV